MGSKESTEQNPTPNVLDYPDSKPVSSTPPNEQNMNTEKDDGGNENKTYSFYILGLSIVVILGLTYYFLSEKRTIFDEMDEDYIDPV